MSRIAPPARWLALYLLVALSAQTWPGYTWAGARVEPRVLGLPFCFAWVIGWVALTFVALMIFYRADDRRRTAESSR